MIFFNKSVQSGRTLRGLHQILFRQSDSNGIAARIWCFKRVENKRFFIFYFFLCTEIILGFQIINFKKRNMNVKSSGNSRRISMHIIHSLKHMPHQTESCPSQIMQNLGNITPVSNLFFRLSIPVKCTDNDISDLFSHSDGNTGKLRHGADIVIFKLYSCTAVAQVKCFPRLQSNENHRLLHIAHDRCKN